MQQSYNIRFSDLLNHLNSDAAKRYPVTVIINGEFYNLTDDRPNKPSTPAEHAENLPF